MMYLYEVKKVKFGRQPELESPTNMVVCSPDMETMLVMSKHWGWEIQFSGDIPAEVTPNFIFAMKHKTSGYSIRLGYVVSELRARLYSKGGESAVTEFPATWSGITQLMEAHQKRIAR